MKARLARESHHGVFQWIDRGVAVAPESVALLFERYHRTTAGKARAETTPPTARGRAFGWLRSSRSSLRNDHARARNSCGFPSPRRRT
jgi:hypothetical protein